MLFCIQIERTWGINVQEVITLCKGTSLPFNHKPWEIEKVKFRFRLSEKKKMIDYFIMKVAFFGGKKGTK